MVLAYYGYGYGYDPTWILLVITGIIAVVAQIRVSSSFAKYSKVESRTGITGAEAAERILHSKGIYDVRIQHITTNRLQSATQKKADHAMHSPPFHFLSSDTKISLITFPCVPICMTAA